MSTTLTAEASNSTIRHLRVNGERLRVDVRPGDGTGTPLLMCCGIGASFEVLQGLVDALDPGIEVIRVDVPGVGGSPVGALPYSFVRLARTLDAMLDQLGYGRVDVLGFSWGGALAQQFAVQYSSRCRRLVLISTNTGLLSVPGDPTALVSIATPQGIREFVGATADSVGGRDLDLPSRDLRRLFRHSTVAISGRGYLYQLLALAGWTSLPFLPLIRQPTLILCGDDDPLVPAINARIMAKLIPRSSVRIYPGDHLEPLIAAGVFGRQISEFLTDERP